MKVNRALMAEFLELKRRNREREIFRRQIKNAINRCVDTGDFETLDRIQSQFPDLDMLCNAARRAMMRGGVCS